LVSGRAPRVLVLAPTRDITKQISDDLQSIVNDLSIVPVYNNKKKKSDDQEAAILNGCDILVATPDRLKEFLENDKLDFSQVKHVILDGIDQMSDTDDIKKILKQIVKSDEETKAQLIVFSGTMTDSVRKLVKKYLTNDVVTLDLVKGKTQKPSADDDDDEDATESLDGTSADVSGTKDSGPRSLLTKQENYVTYKLTVNDELKGVGLVFTMLRKCLGDDFDAKGACAQISFTKDYKSALFDIPSECDEQIQTYWKDSPTIQMGPVTSLPELDESSTWTGDKEFSRGGSRPSRGGGGDRNGGRSNTCFNCQKEGHKSFECPDASGGQSQRYGGNKSGGGGGGGNACFNCGKDGHKSFECSEPKKAGGRPGGGGGGGSNACFNCGQEGHRSYECTEPKKAGGRPGGGGGGGSNACFNCGKDGHKSFECSEPKKAGGRPGGGGGGGSNACFNCGQEGHRSFECSEPKKDRPSFGSGGRGGGRGGSRGGARGGGAKRSFGDNYNNGHSAGEATSKKIKFDDDDE